MRISSSHFFSYRVGRSTSHIYGGKRRAALTPPTQVEVNSTRAEIDMGVPGLWQELSSTGIESCLPQIAYQNFTENFNQQRGLRVGIDASIWFHHASTNLDGS
jgi:hypothetical protein